MTTPNQSEAFKNPVFGSAQEIKEKIQEIWNNPKKVSLDKKRILMVCVFIIKEKNVWQWACSIRLAHKSKPLCKKSSLWMNFEKISIRGHSVIELEGVGTQEVEETYYEYAYCRYKPLTEQEVEDLNFVHGFDKKDAQNL